MNNKKRLFKIIIFILILIIEFIFFIQVPIAKTTFSSINKSKPPSLAKLNIPIYIDYYHLRIEYLTTSDWTTLEMINIEDSILTMRFIEKIGNPTHVGIEYKFFEFKSTNRKFYK